MLAAQVRNRDQYGRGVASCSLPGPGGDLGAWLVRNGLAVAYRRAAGLYNPTKPNRWAAHAWPDSCARWVSWSVRAVELARHHDRLRTLRSAPGLHV